MQAVILAGGKGTRIGNKEMPKVMIKIGDKPVLRHQVELLKRYGITDIIICVKFLSHKIKEYFGDGKKFGVEITYSEEKEFLGTAGAIKNAENLIKGDFILFYGDVMLNINLTKFTEFHKNKKGMATLMVHGTDHPYDSDIVDVDPESRVRKIWRPKPGEKFRDLSNAAVYVLSNEILKYIPENEFLNLEKDVLAKLIENGIPVYGYESEEYVKDMGTPDRLEKVRTAYEEGKIFRFAVLLDRDGVINEEVDLLHRPGQLKLIEGAAEGIRLLNENGFLVIVVTNQPVVARKMCTEKDIGKIHEKLREMLSKKGAEINGIYYCPHHPDKGYPDEDPAYKIDCKCRKPKTGMLLNAAKDFGLDLSRCFVVGDRSPDIKAGKDANCSTILVKTGYAGKDGKFAVEPDYTCENLLEAAKLIIKTRKGR